jgi:hypothetical protein
MQRAWNEATVGEGFFLPLSLITRPKRTLVLGLGLLAFVFTIGGLWNVAGGFIAGRLKTLTWPTRLPSAELSGRGAAN